MAQGRHRARLSLKPFLEPLLAHKFGPDYLESTVNGQAGMKGLVDICHSASPQALHNLILSNRLSGQISHNNTPQINYDVANINLKSDYQEETAGFNERGKRRISGLLHVQ
jgi:hypothetical protein